MIQLELFQEIFVKSVELSIKERRHEAFSHKTKTKALIIIGYSNRREEDWYEFIFVDGNDFYQEHQLYPLIATVERDIFNLLQQGKQLTIENLKELEWTKNLSLDPVRLTAF